MPHDRLKVGVICQTLVQQHHIRQIIESCGLQLEKSLLIDQVLKDPKHLIQQESAIDIWMIDIDTQGVDQMERWPDFERWMLNITKPIIFGEGNTFDASSHRFATWCRQLKAKVVTISGQLQTVANQQRAQSIWVLAASAGGPEAVKQFLDHLPTGLGIGFLYVQHIEQRQHRPLVDTITRDSDYISHLATHGDVVTADTLTLVPVSEQIKILPSGMIISHYGKPWRGPYQPSIDQVVANVAMISAGNAGAIFFSGMGEDGVDGARLMARQKGQVWTQALSSCASESMPQAIYQTGLVSQTGTPQQLAEFIMARMQPAANARY